MVNFYVFTKTPDLAGALDVSTKPALFENSFWLYLAVGLLSHRHLHKRRKYQLLHLQQHYGEYLAGSSAKSNDIFWRNIVQIGMNNFPSNTFKQNVICLEKKFAEDVVCWSLVVNNLIPVYGLNRCELKLRSLLVPKLHIQLRPPLS
jgi:hypothetical protein